MITIAGRQVQIGDSLYNTALQAWGVVTRYDSLSAVVRLTGANGRPRDLYVQQGGMVGGVRVFYWHEPLELDRPYQDVQKYQRLLDAIVGELP